MEWATKTVHRTNIEIEGQYYSVRCESDDDEFALFINNEYICSVDVLPTEDEITEQLYQQKILNETANGVFTRRIS